MADDAATVEQLRAELAASRVREAALSEDIERRDYALAEALEQQTVTVDVLKVISRSAFDVQAVLDTLVESACRLCNADTGIVYRFDGDFMRLAAMRGSSPEHRAVLERSPKRAGRESMG